MIGTCRVFFFFFNDTATTEIYTLSLHDALPISRSVDLHLRVVLVRSVRGEKLGREEGRFGLRRLFIERLDAKRSEEHTSELQSQSNLVCRLLLEKKNISPPCTKPLHGRMVTPE